MKIKDLPPDKSLTNVRFYDPNTGALGYWYSQWGYEDGKAGVWYKNKPSDSRIIPLFLDKLQQALEFEVVDDKWKPPKKKRVKPPESGVLLQ